MQADITVTGKVIAKYQLPKDEVDELNEIFDQKKFNLKSHSDSLAGNVTTETDILNLISTVPIIHSMYECMQDHVHNIKLFFNDANEDIKDYHITGAWINDMVEGDFNPPHVHHVQPDTNTALGYSTVLFLKVPEMLPVKNIKKEYLNGQLGFADVKGESTISFSPVVGDFYIFNANHQHFVLPFKLKNKNRTRRSLSFNFITTVNDGNIAKVY
tara:strand:- start:411 stop:1052 length:642 start_codon:yes stop_codon:yes gene_type:complete